VIQEAAMSYLILLTCEGGDIRGDIAGMSQIGKAGSPASTPHRGDEETHDAETTSKWNVTCLRKRLSSNGHFDHHTASYRTTTNLEQKEKEPQ
jgi:hypothetical protein